MAKHRPRRRNRQFFDRYMYRSHLWHLKIISIKETAFAFTAVLCVAVLRVTQKDWCFSSRILPLVSIRKTVLKQKWLQLMRFSVQDEGISTSAVLFVSVSYVDVEVAWRESFIRYAFYTFLCECSSRTKSGCRVFIVFVVFFTVQKSHINFIEQKF